MTKPSTAAELKLPRDVARSLRSENPGPEATLWVEDLVSRVDRQLGVRVRIGDLELGASGSRDVALAVVEAFRAHHVAHRGLPSTARVLEGPLEKTVVPSESSRRCLLPHHDGGRSSFLTPSTLQAQWWRPEWRGLVADPPAQKTFQGFLVVAPGPDGAHTGFYPWVALLSGAFEFQTGETANPTTLPSWAGENIRATLALSENRTQYLSLAGALGSRREAHALQPVHSAHDRLGPLAAAHLRADPEPPGCDCLQPGDRFWCSGLRETTGLTWSGLRRRRETQVRAMRHDLVLGHNLAAVHAGFGGGAGRTLLPLCVTVDRPRGTEFERWLTRLWDEAFALQHPL